MTGSMVGCEKESRDLMQLVWVMVVVISGDGAAVVGGDGAAVVADKHKCVG